MSIFPTYGVLQAPMVAPARAISGSSAGARQAATAGPRTWSFDGSVEAAFLVPNEAIAGTWPSALEVAKAIVAQDAGTSRLGVNIPLKNGVYVVVVKAGSALLTLPAKLQVLAPGSYRLERRGPGEAGPDYRWTLNGRSMDLQPAMAGHVPTWVWADANGLAHFGAAPTRPMTDDEWARAGRGQMRRQEPGPRTWSFDSTVEDAFLIPNRVLNGRWPTKSELRAAQLLHDTGRDPYGAGREVPIGVYSVVVIEGGVPKVLDEKVQVLEVGNMILRKDPYNYAWSLNGKNMELHITNGHADTWVWPGSRYPDILPGSDGAGRFGATPTRPMTEDEWAQSGQGQLRRQAPGPRTWSFDATVEDAFLIPNRAIHGRWPNDTELRAAQLLHDSGRDPYGAGRDVPVGVYSVVVLEGGVPIVLPLKLQVLDVGDMVLTRKPDQGPWTLNDRYAWTLNGKQMDVSKPSRSKEPAWVWPGSRFPEDIMP